MLLLKENWPETTGFIARNPGRKEFAMHRQICIMLLLFVFFACACSPRVKDVTEKDRLATTSYYRLAYDFYLNNDVPQAIKSLQEAEKYNPYDRDVKNLYGIIYLGKAMYDKAEASFKETVRIDPQFSDGYVGLAATYMAQNRWQDAIDALKKPSEDITYYRKDVVFDNLGWCQHMLGENDKALTSLKQATMENPKNCHAYYNLGKVYRNLGQYPEAIEALKTSVIRCDKFFYGYYELSLVAIKARDNTTAREALTKCIELGSNSVEARECEKYLKLMQ